VCTGQLTAAEQAKTLDSHRPRASTDNAVTQAVRSALTIVVWMDGNRTYATVGYLTWRLTGYTRSCCSATDRVGTSLDSMNKAVAVSTGALWGHTVGTVDGGYPYACQPFFRVSPAGRVPTNPPAAACWALLGARAAS